MYPPLHTLRMMMRVHSQQRFLVQLTDLCLNRDKHLCTFQLMWQKTLWMTAVLFFLDGGWISEGKCTSTHRLVHLIVVQSFLTVLILLKSTNTYIFCQFIPIHDHITYGAMRSPVIMKCQIIYQPLRVYQSSSEVLLLTYSIQCSSLSWRIFPAYLSCCHDLSLDDISVLV